jgi:hypothetical protein
MRLTVLVVVLAAILIALLALNGNILNDKSQLAPSKELKSPVRSNESGNQQTFLFIETQKHKNGTVISGNPSDLAIDFPTYDLRNSTLSTVERIELNSSTKAIYGNEFQISGDIGSGTSSGLYPVKDLPYSYGEINILSIEGDNVTLECYRKNVTLVPGGSWKIETIQPEKIGEGLLNVTTTVTVYNHGKVVVKVDR